MEDDDDINDNVIEEIIRDYQSAYQIKCSKCLFCVVTVDLMCALMLILMQHRWWLCSVHSVNTYVPLHLGQGLVFSLLDNNDNDVSADFYSNSPRYGNGCVSITLPNINYHDHNEDILSHTFGNKERLDMVSYF